ncbi:MAG: toxin-antitoxin system antidote component [Algoriphagus marincola HL-49]|uniref:Toxin-antitoxin system antidote component n=1 Tax=Algoriphagus marincola HL-49 TaxID=1305737 RepID=A0A0P7YFT9_9BACT|nr:MAG: toxin-antitoxin system antidote component [Algoriphagus marincola HL-49]
MKKRLNITIDEKLLEKIKQYAAKEEKSISNLVEEHFEKLVRRRTGLPEGMSLVEYMRSLPKSKIDFPEDFDWKEEYYKAKAKKWGYEDLF